LLITPADAVDTLLRLRMVMGNSLYSAYRKLL